MVQKVEVKMRPYYRWKALVFFLFIFGCAGATPQESLEGIDLSTKEQKCVQGCSNTYSSCIQNAAMSGGNRLVANDIIRACGGALKICVNTCEPKK